MWAHFTLDVAYYQKPMPFAQFVEQTEFFLMLNQNSFILTHGMNE